nr:restriction system-associated AAA family ATPase [uncultured Desulfobacter sp.]
MKLLRLKITDPKGFRSLQSGFEYRFCNQRDFQKETIFSPYICAGRNGSGKSNLLEALAAIFYHLECIYLTNLPDSFRYDEETNPGGFRSEKATPDGFEIEYFIKRPKDFEGDNEQVQIKIIKLPGQSPQWQIWHLELNDWQKLPDGQGLRRSLLPEYILGYSSGENEILSLPFFKMRFVQYDEYWQTLKQQLSYDGRPESRLVFLDKEFSQAILICNLLFQDKEALRSLCRDVEIEEFKEFRIIIRRSIKLDAENMGDFIGTNLFEFSFGEGGFKEDHPAVSRNDETGDHTVNLMQLLEAEDSSADRFDPAVTRLKRCATCWYLDESGDTLTLDYYVNEATRKAFRNNFSNDPLELFQAFQALLTLNLFSVSQQLKTDLYQSDSQYVSETVPSLASDERIMRFKFVKFRKKDINEPVMLKSLSDGEHQLLHTLGLCLLFKNTQSLFLLDEPETHFNPDWRANFVSRLLESFKDSHDHEMLITTHTPFLISDSRPEKVLVFNKSEGIVSVSHPDYNTLGASINKITMATFGKRETIGGHAQAILADLRRRFEQGEDKNKLIAEINHQLGDSVEKVLLIKTILDSMEKPD